MGDEQRFGLRRSSGVRAIEIVHVMDRRCALVVDGVSSGRWSDAIGAAAEVFARSGKDGWKTDDDFAHAIDRMAFLLDDERPSGFLSEACSIEDDKSTG